MGSAGGSRSVSDQSSRPPNTSFLNPMGGVLANMFGIGTDISQGGIGYTGSIGPERGDINSQNIFDPGAGWKWDVAQQKLVEVNPSPFAERVFDPTSFSNIADLGNYTNLGGAGAAGIMGGWEDYLTGPVDATMREGLETGFKTDMDPIIAEAQRVYRDETMPQVAQQFAGQTGSFSTDFLGAQAREGAAMGSQLGALEAQMSEQAADRRVGMLPMAGMPAELANLGLGVGGEYQLAATPGGQQATLMQLLLGAQPTSAISRGNISEGDSWSTAWGGSYSGPTSGGGGG